MKTHSKNMQRQNCLSSAVLRLFALLFVLVLGTSGFAQQGGRGQGQGGPTPEDRAKRQTEMMKTQLNLTAAQEPKVADINLKYAKRIGDARNIADTAVQRKTMKNFQTQKEKDLKGILTDTQFKEYLKMVEEMKNRRREGPH